MTLGGMRGYVPAKNLNQLWRRAAKSNHSNDRKCPSCNRPMVMVLYSGHDTVVEVDVCRSCQFVWFDSDEFEAFCPDPIRPDVKPELSPEVAKKVALLEAQMAAYDPEAAMQKEILETGLRAGALFANLPVKESIPQARIRPYVTWGLLIALVLVYRHTLEAGPVGIIEKYALDPSHALRMSGLTFFTSFFLHAGVWHLLANAYFLWFVGDNIEERIGRVRYVLLIACATFAGGLAHCAFDDTRLIGASGGISGLIVFFALTWPGAKVGMLIWFAYLRIPVLAAFSFWIVSQVVLAYRQTAGTSDVSAIAHLGGAAVGVALWMLWGRRFEPAEREGA